MQFRQTMDSHSREIIKEGKFIGFLQWHSDRPPHVVLHHDFTSLSLTEMQECIDEYERIRPQPAIEYTPVPEKIQYDTEQILRKKGLID